MDQPVHTRTHPRLQVNFVYEYITDMQEANKGSNQSQRCLCIDLYIRHTHMREGQEIQAIRSTKRRPPTASRQVTSKQPNSGNPATRSELFRVLDMTVTRLIKLNSDELFDDFIMLFDYIKQVVDP